jgi:hypothetical protein
VPLVACHSHTTKLLQRCSRPLCSSQGTGGTTPDDDRVHLVSHTEVWPRGAVRRTGWSKGRIARNPSGPNSVPDYDARSAALSTPASWLYSRADQTSAPNSRRSTNEQRRLETFARETTTGQHTEACCRWLLRKEVIQPHLPVRLPCYDFVPIASPTFDGSLHKGWATGFGCCRLS